MRHLSPPIIFYLDEFLSLFVDINCLFFMNLTPEVFLDGINKIFLIFLYPEHPARPPRLAGSHGG